MLTPPNMRELIEGAQSRPDYIPPTAEQIEFADRVVWLTMTNPGQDEFTQTLALAYAESAAAGVLSHSDLDKAARMRVLLEMNRRGIEEFIGRKLPW